MLGGVGEACACPLAAHMSVGLLGWLSARPPTRPLACRWPVASHVRTSCDQCGPDFVLFCDCLEFTPQVAGLRPRWRVYAPGAGFPVAGRCGKFMFLAAQLRFCQKYF